MSMVFKFQANFFLLFYQNGSIFWFNDMKTHGPHEYCLGQAVNNITEVEETIVCKCFVEDRQIKVNSVGN